MSVVTHAGVISGNGQLFVVATRPMLVGNRPQQRSPVALEQEGRAVVLIGQAPVKVIPIHSSQPRIASFHV